MSTTFEFTKSRTRARANGHHASWAALGVILVAVLAVGESLVYVVTAPQEPSLAVLPAIQPAKATKDAVMPEAPAPTTGHRAGR